jgi:hypothetical protein
MMQRQAGSTTKSLFRVAALLSLCLLVTGCGGSSGGAQPTEAETGATLGTGIGSGTPDAAPADGGAFGTGRPEPSEESDGDGGRY